MTLAWNPRDALLAADKAIEGLGRFVFLDSGKVRLDLAGGGSLCFDLMPCEKLSSASLLHALNLARNVPHPLVASPHVNKKLGEELREASVPFVDSAGNVFLKGERVLVWQVGARPVTCTKPGEGTVRMRAFQTTGLKFLYEVMVRDCSLVAKTYRELNALSGVSLGAIGSILQSLNENGFLVEVDGKRRLVNRRELLAQWCAAYRQRLRPKNLVGRFSLGNRHGVSDLSLPSGVLLGGEKAAAMLTGAIRPEIITLYTQIGVNLCIAKLGLREDASGDVELLTSFWHTPAEEADRVPPLLVYADLITSGSWRNAEAARLVYDQFLEETFA